MKLFAFVFLSALSVIGLSACKQQTTEAPQQDIQAETQPGAQADDAAAMPETETAPAAAPMTDKK
jgi:hypothetical protein